MLVDRLRGLGRIWGKCWGIRVSWISLFIKTPLVLLHLANGAPRYEGPSVWWGFMVLIVRQWPAAKQGEILGPSREVVFRVLEHPGLAHWQEWCCARGVWVKLVPENDWTPSHTPMVCVGPGAMGVIHAMRHIKSAEDHTTVYMLLNTNSFRSLATTLLQSKARRRTPRDIAARLWYRLKKRFSRQSISLDVVKRSD